MSSGRNEDGKQVFKLVVGSVVVYEAQHSSVWDESVSVADVSLQLSLSMCLQAKAKHTVR